jgi:hypothetical protein
LAVILTGFKTSKKTANEITDDRLYQMSHSAKILSAIFYEHALAAILAVSVIHAKKREQSTELYNNWRTYSYTSFSQRSVRKNMADFQAK